MMLDQQYYIILYIGNQPSRCMKQEKILSGAIRTGVMYIRESTEEQGKGYSPDAQRKGIKEYAKRHNIKIVGEYIDLLSGRTDNRPQFQQMIADAEAGKFEAVLVFKTSRFARNRKIAIHYKDRLRRIGIQVISTSEDIGGNFSDSNKGLMEGFYELFDEHLSNQISEWTQEGFKEKRSLGYLNGNAPFGYKRIKTKKGEEPNTQDLIIDRKKATIVREMYELYATGNYSLQDIAVRLNGRGLLTRKNNQFTYSSIKTMLQNRAYLGLVPAAKPDQQELAGKHKAIVSEELYDRVQLMFKARTKTKGRPPAKHRFYLLQGLVFCYRCYDRIKGKEDVPHTSKMLPTMYCETQVSRDRQERYMYCCKFHRENKSCVQKPAPCNVIDKQVLEFISGMEMPDSIIKQVLKRLERAYDVEMLLSTPQPKDEREVLKAKLDKLNHVYVHTEALSIEKYNAEAAKITKQLNALVKTDKPLGLRQMDKEAQLKATEKYLRNIPYAIAHEMYPPQEMQAWIRAIIKRIWVKDRKVIAIEPHDDYKGCFAATRKVLGQRPSGTPHKILQRCWGILCYPVPLLFKEGLGVVLMFFPFAHQLAILVAYAEFFSLPFSCLHSFFGCSLGFLCGYINKF
ncbi:recombinase family protein [Patescibacteria group bacterium]|nr:MAG: recombinase family protein [Patescibacteria group bacterium]